LFFLYTGNNSCGCDLDSLRRDNSNFITWAFWNHVPAPTYCDIIAALYWTWAWDETAYTQHWSWYDLSCSLASGNTNIEYIPAWNGNIPDILTADIIYILSSWDHLYSHDTYWIRMSWCNTIIWNWDVRIYSTWQIATYWMINNISHEYDIIDNVKINWESDGGVWTHNRNKYGVYIKRTNNNTINNVNVYMNTGYGLYFDWVSNSLINNIYVYNNKNWVSIWWE